MSEHEEQKALFDWANWEAKKYPELNRLFAIPNGGSRHLLVAKKLKAEGVKAGVPDIFFPLPKKPYHGLWIEMKYGKNKLTKEQEKWLNFLNERGYKAIVCYSSEEAIDVIRGYIK